MMEKTDLQNTVEEGEPQEKAVRLQKLRALRESGINPFAYTFSRTHTLAEILVQYDGLQIDEKSEDKVATCGRLVAKRGHGKATFGNILDESTKIQIYANVDTLGEVFYERYLSLDVGDIIGVSGRPFRTKRGELSLFVEEVTLLTKSLSPLPEKYHGLQDKELRYRMRYVDLIANPEVRVTFKTRSQILGFIRSFLANSGFMEVETPVLHSLYGGASAKPFVTHHNALDQRLYLRIALELHLKRLVVGGFEKVFEIGRVFRNEGISFKHNPEYTLLELYQAYADYTDVMALTESLLSSMVHHLFGSYNLVYQGKDLDFTPPFQRMTLKESLLRFANMDADASLETLLAFAKKLGLDDTVQPVRGQLIAFIYDKAVEHHLVQPTFIVDYPWETSPLAKKKRDNPELVERFELIIHGMEVANAFSELNDPEDQFERFSEQVAAKKAGWEETHEMDEDYINALNYGLPPTGGLGIGIDRVVMLMTDMPSIRDVLFFPHLREKL